MKKTFKMLAMLATCAALLTACTKDEVDGDTADNGGSTPQTEADVPDEVGFDANGASDSLFSVSATHQVRFSRGNLQYRALTNTWRFAEHQFDCIGEDDTNVAYNYNGWIDLFGWGTSGWNSGATYYRPWDVMTQGEGYFPGSDWNNDLTGAYAEADWAWHNPIVNGGNTSHTWRTLTAEEWKYLLEDRTDAANKWGLATIGNVHGMVILPDNWTLPAGLSFVPGMDSTMDNYSHGSTYTYSEWSLMEAAGAIFLPAAGFRVGLTGDTYHYPDEKVMVDGWNIGGDYWSSSHYDTPANGFEQRYAYYMFFNARRHKAKGNMHRSFGFSVRPVKD